jgi:hypothetical protein
MTVDPDTRKAFVAGPRALAGFLASHPEVPVPDYGTAIGLPVVGGTDEDERGELGRVDAKCATLAGLTGAAVAFTAAQAAGQAPVIVRAMTAVAGLAFAASALVLLLAVLRPALGHIGFCRWAVLSTREIESRAKEQDDAGRTGGVPAIEAAQAARVDAAESLRVLSVIAVTKYRWLRLAVDLAAAGVVLLAGAAVAGVAA